VISVSLSTISSRASLVLTSFHGPICRSTLALILSQSAHSYAFLVLVMGPWRALRLHSKYVARWSDP
jgi:hypothetical protein